MKTNTVIVLREPEKEGEVFSRGILNIYPDIKDLLHNLGSAYTVKSEHRQCEPDEGRYAIYSNGKLHSQAQEESLISVLNQILHKAQKRGA